MSALALVALTSAAEAQKPAFRGFPANRDIAIRVQNLVGLTRVVGWDRDSVDAAATIAKGESRFYAGGTRSGAKLIVDNQGMSGSDSAVLIIRVPKGARVWIKSGSARVEIESVLGEVEVVSVTGTITVAGDPKLATLETIDGDVTVRGEPAVLRVRTGAGAVRLSGPRLDVSATTVQGDIVLHGGELRSARLESVSGAVEVTGRLPSGRLEIATHDGNVQVLLGRPLDAKFDMESLGGQIVTRLFDRPERVYHDGVAKFSVGPGAGSASGGTLSVRSFKGTIRVESSPKL